jgi:uncharacterized protein (DUF924 family)
MYAGDDRALVVTKRLIEDKRDEGLVHARRVFTYMPLMHSEALADQDQCVACFDKLTNGCAPELKPSLEQTLRYAIAHRDIVAKWGRFPHRNEVLGRASSPEELEFLKQPGSSF